MAVATPLIMIVDDEELFVNLVSYFLVHEGYATISCTDSTEAYRIVLEHNPSLIILDLQLGNPMSGLVLLDLIRLDPLTKHIPIVICSGATSLIATTERRLRRQGCTILEKPFELDVLLGHVQAAIGPPLRTNAVG